MPRYSPLYLLSSSRGIFGYGINTRPDWHREDLTALLELLHTGQVQPIIAERFPLSEAAEAHRMLNQGGVLGKIVLIP